MEHLPKYISVLFVITTFLTIFLFYKASNNSKATLIVLLSWLLIQGVCSLFGFYTITTTFPPRFLLLVGPPFLIIFLLFITTRGRNFIDQFDVKTLTILHFIRIPVEMVLFWLFLRGVVPQLMTFEGRNFDVLSGVSAPVIYYFGFIKNKLGNKSILVWNFICLALLINIVVNAIFSAPFAFQKFAFDQPNVAILYFPFIWLPCCIVPIVLAAHLIAIRQLFKKT